MGGVDFLQRERQTPVATGIRVATAPPLRNPDRRPATLVSGIGHRGYTRGVQSVDDAVLAGGAHVVLGAGQSG
jgi:hypothetical protein